MDIRETIIRELSLQCLDKLLADVMLQIELLILRPLIIASITSDRADVNHAIPEFHKSTSHNRQVQFRNVLQAELDELLVFVFSEPANEGGRGEGLAETDCGETVFGEAEIEEGCYVYGAGAELFLLFGEIGAADVADGDFLAKRREEGEHCGGDCLCCVSMYTCLYLLCLPSAIEAQNSSPRTSWHLFLSYYLLEESLIAFLPPRETKHIN